MDPYRVLGVSTGATKDEIKAAFRKLALVHHPDLHVNASAAVKANAESTFRALNEAYSALTDGNFRYREASSPGRAGFRRGAAGAGGAGPQYSSYHYQGGASYSGYDQFRRCGGFSTFGARPFVATGSMLLSAALGGVFVLSLALLDPLAAALWEQHNAGRGFDDVDDKVAAARAARLEEMRAAREARWEREAAQRRALEHPGPLLLPLPRDPD